MTGKTVLVTGASGGIGLEAAGELAAAGAELVLVARDKARGEKAVAEVKARAGAGAGPVSLLLADMGKQAEVRHLADEYQAKHARLDVLVNNAGSVNAQRAVTADGLEETFAVNHLGGFLLTNLLLDLLKKSAPARVVNVASVGHFRGNLDFDNLQYEKGGYQIMRAYTRSKLANVLFTSELSKRLAGSGVTVNCLHPGAVATAIWSKAPWFALPILAIAKLFMISPKEGGSRVAYLAMSPEVEGQTGGYYDKNKKVWPSRSAQDPELARRLWETSARLTHLAA